MYTFCGKYIIHRMHRHTYMYTSMYTFSVCERVCVYVCVYLCMAMAWPVVLAWSDIKS